MKPGAWKAAIKRCSHKWRRMTIEEREPYNAMAAEEQGLREEAMQQPFSASKGPDTLGTAAFNAAAQLSRNALKCVSLQRLVATYKRYTSSLHWKDFDCGLATAQGAMSLDKIDLVTRFEEVENTWATFIAPAENGGNDQGLDIEDCATSNKLHHSVCGSFNGVCKQMPCFEPASKLAASLHHFIKQGALANCFSE